MTTTPEFARALEKFASVVIRSGYSYGDWFKTRSIVRKGYDTELEASLANMAYYRGKIPNRSEEYRINSKSLHFARSVSARLTTIMPEGKIEANGLILDRERLAGSANKSYTYRYRIRRSDAKKEGQIEIPFGGKDAEGPSIVIPVMRGAELLMYLLRRIGKDVAPNRTVWSTMAELANEDVDKLNTALYQIASQVNPAVGSKLKEQKHMTRALSHRMSKLFGGIPMSPAGDNGILVDHQKLSIPGFTLFRKSMKKSPSRKIHFYMVASLDEVKEVAKAPQLGNPLKTVGKRMPAELKKAITGDVVTVHKTIPILPNDGKSFKIETTTLKQSGWQAEDLLLPLSVGELFENMKKQMSDYLRGAETEAYAKGYEDGMKEMKEKFQRSMEAL
jgi:hypothetical protein